MRAQNSVFSLIILLFFVGSAIPVGADVAFGFSSERGIQLFTGTFRDVYSVGDEVTVFGVLWKTGYGPLQGEQITLKVYKYGRYDYWYHDPHNRELILTVNVTTDETGLATNSFVLEEPGRYHVVACYGLVCTDEVWRGDFTVIDPGEPYYFIPKNFMVRVNSTVELKWTLIRPFTKLPYSEQINLTIPGLGIEERLTPVNGTITYKLELEKVAPNRLGNYEVYIDNKKAGFIWVTDNPRLFVVGDRRIYEGDSATVVVFLYDPVSGTPVSGELDLNLTYYYRNGSSKTEMRTVEVRDGYYALAINDTMGVDRLHPYFGGYNQGWGYTIDVIPTGTNSWNGARFDLEPKKQVVYPGQSVTLMIRGYNTTDNSPPEGNYSVKLVWFIYTGQGKYTNDEYVNMTEINVRFDDSNEVLRRIHVPKDASWGYANLGGKRAEFHVVKPYMGMYVSDINLSSSTADIYIGLRNRTLYYDREFSSYYNPLPNETGYLFYWNGTKILKTDESGMVSEKVPVNINPKLPLGFGVHKAPDTQSQWYLAIHTSGAWDNYYTMAERKVVGITVEGRQVILRKFEDSTWNKLTNVPLVVEILGSARGLVTGAPVSEYWNTSEATFSLSPGMYEIRIMPNHWHSIRPHNSGIQGDLYTSKWITILPDGLNFLAGEKYFADKPGFLEVPVKLPSGGAFFVRYWSDGQEFFYFNETDENGNGVVKIYVPKGSEGRTYEYWIRYGFMSVNYAFFGLEKTIRVTLTRDTLPPTVDLEISPEAQDVGKNVTITLDVRDSSGVDTVKVEVTSITGRILNKTITVGGASRFNYEFNFTIRALEDYMIKVWANDTRGNSIYRIANFFGRVKEEKKVELENNKTHEINVANTTEIAINANDNGSVTVNVTVSSEIEDDTAKFKMGGKGYEDLKYVKVETNKTVNYNWVILNLTYDENVLKKLGIPESAVMLFYWNGSEWIDLSESVGKTIPDNSPYGNITVFNFGGDSKNNYVWANVSHLSEYTLAVKLPDLTVVGISPKTAYTGEETTIKVSIRNLGGPTEKPFKVALYVDGTIQGVKQVNGLESDETKTAEFLWEPLTNKTYVLKAVVDYNDQIIESNETNNEVFSMVTVTSRKQAPSRQELGGSIVTLNFIYYRYYSMANATFEKLLAQAKENGVDNETIWKALEYRELAGRWYSKAEAYGPIIANLVNPKVLPPLRNAYLNLMKAVKLLRNALAET